MMPSCTAGGVRFRYEVADPEYVSLLAELVTKTNNNKYFGVDARVMESGVVLGFMHGGIATAKEMIRVEESDSLFRANTVRGVLTLWAAFVSHFIGASMGLKMCHAPYRIQFAAGAAVWLAFVGAVWIYYWGMSVINVTLLMAAVYGIQLV